MNQNQNQYRPSGPSSLRAPVGPAIRQTTHLVRQQTGGSFDQVWKCSFCGSIHSSECDRDIHMTDQCTASPMVVRDDNTVPLPARRPPMMKSHTIQIPSDPMFYPHGDPNEAGPPIQGYGYHNQPNQPLFQNQARGYQMRPSYPPYPPTQAPHLGYNPDPQEQGAPYLQGVNRGRALPDPPQEAIGTKVPQNFGGQTLAIVPNLPNPLRRPGDTVPLPIPVSPTHRPGMTRNLTGSKSVNEEPQIPFAKMQSPLNYSSESRVKVVLVWSKERPTLEREITFFDSNSQDPLSLLWTEEKALYQGNGSLNVGQHSGSLLFPTTGEMVPVQTFEVVRKQMGLSIIILKLHEGGKAMDTGVGDRNEQVAKQGLELKDRDQKIEAMKLEIQELTEVNNTVQSDKQKCKQDLIKQDEQLIQTLLELSELRNVGRDNEVKLRDDVDRLKMELRKQQELQELPRSNESETENVLKLNENIRNLQEKIRHLEEQETELKELKATFGILAKEGNKLTEENVEMRTKQLAYEVETKDLHEAIKEYQIRNQELSNELSELQHTNSVVKEGQFDSLMAENSKLQNSSKQLSEDLKKREIELNARVNELTEFKEKQQQTIENNNKQHLSELQKKENSIANLENELETIKTDFGKERDEILKRKELEISNLKQEIERTGTELRGEVEQQREELEYLQGQSSRNEENANIIEDLTSEKSSLEQTIESLKEENKKLTLKLIENAENLKLTAELDNANDQILKLKQSNSSNEDHLRRKINGLANENMELNNNINTFRFKIEEQNNLIIASKQSQRETDKTQTQLETKDKQISDLKLQILDQQAKEQTNQNQVEKQLKELNDEIEQLQSDNVDLENVIKSEQNTEKLFALDSDKRVLEDQIDLLHGQIETLTLSQQEGKQKIEDLEGSYENLTNQSKDLEIQLGESKSDFTRLQTEREETSQHSQQLIDELKTELEAARNERDRERDNSVISKQLITKLNSDIKNLEQNDSGQRIAELERLLAETEKARTDTELKLGDMAAEIAHRDTRIHTLRQDIGIFQNKAQVTKSTSTPSMPANTSKTKDDKKSAKVSKDQTKEKHPDTSGATPGATISDLTPQIVPVANKSGRAPLKFLLRPGIPVSAVKLKAFPNPTEYQGTKVICIVNKRYELGIFMVLFEIQTRLNMRNVTVKYVGIILDSPVGNCNGEFRTKRYFECEPNCGIFVPFEDVLVPVV